MNGERGSEGVKCKGADGERWRESNGWHVEGVRLGMRGSVGGGWSADGERWRESNGWHVEGARLGMRGSVGWWEEYRWLVGGKEPMAGM